MVLVQWYYNDITRQTVPFLSHCYLIKLLGKPSTKITAPDDRHVWFFFFYYSLFSSLNLWANKFQLQMWKEINSTTSERKWMADPLFFTAFFMYATCMVVTSMVLDTNPASGVDINCVEVVVVVVALAVVVDYMFQSSAWSGRKMCTTNLNNDTATTSNYWKQVLYLVIDDENNIVELISLIWDMKWSNLPFH